MFNQLSQIAAQPALSFGRAPSAESSLNWPSHFSFHAADVRLSKWELQECDIGLTERHQNSTIIWSRLRKIRMFRLLRLCEYNSHIGNMPKSGTHYAHY